MTATQAADVFAKQVYKNIDKQNHNRFIVSKFRRYYIRTMLRMCDLTAILLQLEEKRCHNMSQVNL